jgi:hypothetical protein
MTIEELRKHIVTVASHRYVIKTNSTPPTVKYTNAFLEEFNKPEIIDSETEEKQALSQSKTQAEPKDDDSTTLDDGSTNLLEDSPDSNTKQPPKNTPKQKNQSPTQISKNIVSPPAKSIMTATRETPTYQVPTQLQYPTEPHATHTIEQEQHNEGNGTEEHVEHSEIIDAIAQMDTQFQHAVNELEPYMGRKREDQDEIRTLSITQMTEEVVQSALKQISQRIPAITNEIQERTQQLNMTLKILEETERQLDIVQDKTKQALAMHDALQKKLEEHNTKIHDDYNCRKYQ